MRLLFSILLIGCAHGQLLPELSPEVPDSKPIEALPSERDDANVGPVDSGELLIARLQSIHLLSPAGERTLEVRGGIFVDADLLLPSPKTLASRLAAWLGRPLTDESLGALGDLILSHYDTEGYPVVLVDAPEQDLSGGSLKIVIEVGTIGRIGMSRLKYGELDLLQRGLSLSTGDTLRRGDLEAQLDWYGRTPFRKPRLFVSPGLTPASADLLIGIQERRPWRAYTGYENTGPDLLGRERFRIGAAGLLPGEHLVAWQSVLGVPASTLQAHALHWEIPFHRPHHLLRFDAAYATVESSYLLGGRPVENEGTSWSLAALYQMPLPGFGGWRHFVALGAEVKATNQFVLFGGGPISPGHVVMAHGKLEYGLERIWKKAGLRLLGTALAAPGGLGSDNSDAAFRAYDAMAESSYLVGRLDGEAWWSPGGGWQLRSRFGGQIADGRLLPSEQFAAGGYTTVRGVAERDVLADNGHHGSFELYSPQIRMLPRSDVRLLAFIDHAWLENRGGSSESLTGAGLGLRMRVTEHVDLRFDQGWRVDGGGARSHFGIVMSY